MPNTMPGNIAKGRFLAHLDALINGLPDVDLATSVDRKTLRAELAAFTGTEPDNPLVTATELAAPDCLVDKWVRPTYATGNPAGLKRWQRDRRHVYRHWFPDPPWKGKLGGNDADPSESSIHGGWFEEQQPVARVVRQGLIHVLDLLGGDRVFDSYWVCAGSHLEVTSVLSPTSVASAGTLTCLFLTPTPPFSRRGKNFKPGLEDIFVSKHRSIQPGELEVPGVSADPHVVTVQLHRPR